MEPRDLYARAVAKWGQHAVLLKLAEECSELSSATVHWVLGDLKPGPRYDDVLEELADVEIMLEQMRSLGMDWSGVRQRKLDRLARLVGAV